MSADGLFWLKILFAIIVGGVGMIGATLPFVLRGRDASDRTIALSDTFAGGVLGAAGLVHLLPGGISGFHAAFPSLSYPLAPLLAGAGFLLILGIESSASARGHDHHAPAADRSPSLQHETGFHPDLPKARHPAILLAVLSIHSVILGLALGAQTGVTGAVIVFLAIIAHKAAAGFALGVGYQRAGVVRSAAMPQLSFFSLMTPLGIVAGAGVGLALSSRPDIIFEAVFDSIGAGTFMYIAALDIIKTEFDDPHFHTAKWTTTTIGFGIMALLAIWL